MESTVNLTAVCIADGFGVLLAIFMLCTRYWSNSKNKTEGKLIRFMLFYGALSCFADAAAFVFDGRPGTLMYVLSYASNFWIYLSNMIMGTLWVLVLITHVTGKRLSKPQTIFTIVMDVIGVLALIVNFFYPVVFTINEHNIYSRGPLFFLYVAIELIFAIDGVAVYFIYRKRNKDSKYFPVWQFVIPILIGMTIQTIVYGVSTIWPGIVISVCGIILGLYNESDAEAEALRQREQDHKVIIEQKEQLETQQKQLEDALTFAESANRAKTTFLNNMSHDIRTPMNAIIGYTGLAASHIDNKEQVQDYLTKIGQSSDHLLSLINDVLDMSRIESGKMNIDEKAENLSEIIHTLRDIIQADIEAKQLDLYIDAVDVKDEDIICDKLRLNQLLLNILSNSIKFTPPRGTITMRIVEKTVTNSGYATFDISIKDNGIGMSEEVLSTIFDPFTRGKSSTVSKIQGTGLGMAIAKNIVDMMGGKIIVESELGKGTEVKLTFEFKLQATQKGDATIKELEGLRGLVVDDNSNTCISVSTMLEEIGMRADWCTSGKEALLRTQEAFNKGDSFKTYIIDWMMPDMNGIEVTRRIRRTVGDDCSIIILTAYDWSDIEEEAKEAGVTAFVNKPMFPSDLHKALETCIGKIDEEEPVIKEESNFTGKHILLVEDNVLNREIAVELLSEYGFTIDEAEDGSIAVEKMKAAKPGDYDLILMDIQMPIMDGYEATRKIRELDGIISQIPILAMTANAFEEDRRQALEAGMNEHIAKPINIDLLHECLEKFL